MTLNIGQIWVLRLHYPALNIVFVYRNWYCTPPCTCLFPLFLLSVYTHRHTETFDKHGGLWKLDKDGEENWEKDERERDVTKGGDWLRNGGVGRRWGVDGGLGRDFVLLCV